MVLRAQTGQALPAEPFLPVHVVRLDFDRGCFGVSFEGRGQ